MDSLQRIVLVIAVFALLGFALAATQPEGAGGVQQLLAPQSSGAPANYARTEFANAVNTKRIALISGHAGNDSGAVCTDASGAATLVEANVNADVAQRVATTFTNGGASVLVLQEYDPLIDNLDADLLLSLHADSCIDASGFKAAYYLHTHTPVQDQRLVDCINREYGAATGLTIHANTVTHNMTEYHAFRKVGVDTPAAILEMGFLGGDGDLLRNRPDVVAQGVVNAIYCYLSGAELSEAEIAPPQ